MRPSSLELETEIKLRVGELSTLGQLLKRLGARRLSPRLHEFNTLYDTRDQTLYRTGRIVRIRVNRAASRGAKGIARGRRESTKSDLQPTQAILTFKGPTGASGGTSRSQPFGYKVRRELEVNVSDARQAEQILDGLGLRPMFRYEKFRTTYALPKIKGVRIEVDETPLGVFLELEGTPRAIDRAAIRLGYSRSDYVTASYGELHRAALRRHGLCGGDLLFKSAKSFS